MSANDRLHAMQTALLECGVQDVKFCFSPNQPAIPSSNVAGTAADFLDAYHKGRFKVVEKIGDAKPKK